MEAFGFTGKSEQAIPLSAVSIAFEPDAMRAFACFVAHAAAEMDRLGPSYDHEHFKDFADTWQAHWPDVQLTRIYGT